MPVGATKVAKGGSHHELGPAPLASFGKICSAEGLGNRRPPEILMNFTGDISHVGFLFIYALSL
jgi:hypothetical protein